MLPAVVAISHYQVIKLYYVSFQETLQSDSVHASLGGSKTLWFIQYSATVPLSRVWFALWLLWALFMNRTVKSFFSSVRWYIFHQWSHFLGKADVALSFVWKMEKTCLMMIFPNDSRIMAQKNARGQTWGIVSVLLISHKAMNAFLQHQGTQKSSYSTIFLHEYINVFSFSAWGQLCCCCFVFFLCSSLSSSQRALLEQRLTALHVHIMTVITLLVIGALGNTAEWGSDQSTPQFNQFRMRKCFQN